VEGDGPAFLFTRQQLIAAALDAGIDIDEGPLIWWEKAGVLPRPTRHHRDGAPRALYPASALHAISVVRQLQNEGLELKDIAQWMRELAEDEAGTLTRLGEMLRGSRSLIAQLVLNEELAGHITPGTIREVQITFLDKNGEVVSRRQSSWSSVPGRTASFTFDQQQAAS